jgi:radical SAM superfamily enzyme YgiQ (UPF0313 family)
MSSLAMHSLYRWFNALPGVVCERTFAGLDRLPSLADPLITLESQHPVHDVAMLAISVSFEMDYLNIVSMLRRSGIPERSDHRERGDPLVIMGGPAVSANPEPLAPMADAIVIGEAEELLADLVDCVRSSQGERMEALSALARLPGVYVPLLHTGDTIRRQWLRNLDEYPTASSIVAPRAEFGDMHLIEISRGCGRGCRFCLAGYWYRPPRERSLELVLNQAQDGLKRLKKVGLVAAAVSDYTHIDELVARLRGMGAGISVSSLRVAPLPETLLRALAESGSRSVALAPEAGSERLRQMINKRITHEDVLRAVALSAACSFGELKLYFMIGLPGETEADIGELIDLAREVQRAFPHKVVLNLTPFVPKAHTPFERAEMAPEALLQERLRRIKGSLGRAHLEVRAEPPRLTRIQGILARGDRRVGEALLVMPSSGASHWEGALRSQGLSAEDYLRARTPDEPLAWDFVDAGVSPAYLATERRRSAEAIATEVCASQECRRCGVCSPEGDR